MLHVMEAVTPCEPMHILAFCNNSFVSMATLPLPVHAALIVAFAQLAMIRTNALQETILISLRKPANLVAKTGIVVPVYVACRRTAIDVFSLVCWNGAVQMAIFVSPSLLEV